MEGRGLPWEGPGQQVRYASVRAGWGPGPSPQAHARPTRLSLKGTNQQVGANSKATRNTKMVSLWGSGHCQRGEGHEPPVWKRDT